MEAEDNRPPEPADLCSCLDTPQVHLTPYRELGMDKQYAEVTLLTCPQCDRLWLRYHYEQEAFTASGRWYLGAITPQQAALLTAENAKAVLEGLDWYFYGGSFYWGRSGRASGQIW